jgi:DNA-binding transcriptional ArsR family regulator
MELEERSETEIDLPPEYCHYRDEGCELADSCLDCPFPGCVLEEPGGKRRWLKKLRAGEMVRLFISEGKGVKELAQMFGVSPRTVQRALKSALNDLAGRGVGENGHRF